MEVLRFKNEKEYLDWLKTQSGAVKDKAQKYKAKYPGTIPIVLLFDFDTGMSCTDAGTHIFIPPDLEWIIDKIVGDP